MYGITYNNKHSFNDLGLTVLNTRVIETPSKIKITETVLRDGHQSLLATRMRLSQMLPQLEALDAIGYKSLEAWGGATFDSCLRFLDEDPWERLDTLKAHLKTPIQMLLRGQNLLGYYQYPDDVVRAFVKKAAQHGIGVFRIFDALNDTRNLKTAVEAAKEAKAEVEHSVEVQGCLVYTVGGPHTIAEFGKLAKELDAMGVDSICIKDMSGLLKPYDAYELVKELKASTKLPIQLHTHYTSGFGSMAYMKAIEAGVDVIDCALSPFAMDTSQPCTETMVAALEGTEYDTGLDRQAMTPIAKHFLGVKKEIIDEFGLKGYFDVNPNVLDFQIPGGMLSNLVNQLKEMGMHLMVSIWPTVDGESENYQEMEELGYLTRSEQGKRLGQLGNAAIIDVTNPDGREYVWSKIKKNYYEKGIHIFWLDEAEPEFTGYEFSHYRYFRGADMEVGNIYPREYARMAYEGPVIFLMSEFLERVLKKHEPDRQETGEYDAERIQEQEK